GTSGPVSEPMAARIKMGVEDLLDVFAALLALVLARKLCAFVVEDAEKEGAHARAAFEAFTSLEIGDEGVLHQLLGVGLGEAHSHGAPEQDGRVLGDEPG